MTLCVYGSRFARTPKPGQVGDVLELGDWMEVFTSKHNSDAHAWPYVRYADGQLATQIRSHVVNGLPGAEGQFLCWLIFLDYDESNDYSDILSRIEDIPESSPLSKWAAIYPTKSGVRLVFRLSEPLTPEEYPAKVRGLALELYKLTKLRVDPTTDEWHRCFRLPCVTRSDGKQDGPTWKQGYWFPTLFTEHELDVDEIPTCDRQLPWKQSKSTAKPLESADMPTMDDSVQGIRLRIYKKVLRNSRFKDVLFDQMPVSAGRRDQTLVAISSEVVSECFTAVPDCSAQEVFALILPVALSFDPDGGEAWETKLWRLVQHCWAGEQKKQQDREDKDALEKTTRDTIIEALLSKLPKEIVPNDPVDRELFAQRHLCLQTTGGVYAVTPSGEYTTSPLKITQLPAYFNGPLSCLDANRFRNAQGKLLNGNEIANHFSTVVDHVRYEPSNEVKSRLVLEGDKKLIEVSPFALRQDLIESAQFDADVDQWLDSFHDSAALKLWLASALAIHRGPTAALFLKGPARAGKSMLGRALAECFGRRPVSGMQAFSEFNGALVDSPIILIDEGLPSRRGGMHTADLFRSLITGSGVSTQRKFVDSADSVTPYRIIMAANSYDMVTELIGRRSLAGEDMDAFRERILVIEPGMGPTQFLDQKGNMAFTADSPKGSWIGGECRLARHLIRLYQLHFEEQTFVRQGRRMLVEGKAHPAFTISFDLSGLGREVVQSLAESVAGIRERRNVGVLLKSIEVDDHGVWVRKWPFSTQHYPNNPAQFARALERFCLPASRRSPSDMSTSFKVDLTKVLICADALGLPTMALRERDKTMRGMA